MKLNKSFKNWLKHADQKYLGGRLKGTVRSTKSPVMPTFSITLEEKEKAQKDLMFQIERPLPTDHELKRVEILVLNYKAPEIEAECAKRLIQHTNWPYKLNLFDNRIGSKNMSKIWNRAVRESTCDYIVIMDSDVYVPKLSPCWLTRMMETFDKHSDCYLVSPMVTRTSGFQQQADKPRDRPPEKMTEEFGGMCLLFKKEVFNKVGWFDEKYLLFGTDTEWSIRLIRSKDSAGYLRPDVVVDHVWHASTAKAAVDERAEYNFRVEKEYSNKLLDKVRNL